MTSGYSLNRDVPDLCVHPEFAPPPPPPVEPPADTPRVIDRIIIPPARTKKVTVEQIQRVTAEHFDIPLSEMTSQRRDRDVARPRQVAMYLSRRFTKRSLPEIGRRFRRDHSTTHHGIRTIERLRENDPDLDADIRAIEAAL